MRKNSVTTRLCGFFCLIFSIIPLCTTLSAQTIEIPALARVEISDWINVKTDITPAAVGDGLADDTAALQAALDSVDGTGSTAKVIYLPPGTYRTTSTIQWTDALGGMLLGHGRNTTILYDGPDGEDLFRSDGATRCYYEGIVFDGNHKARILANHIGVTKFEASISYRYCAFVNSTLRGLHGGSGTFASSEMDIYNCQFENNPIGSSFTNYNYYNMTYRGNLFRNNDVGYEGGASNAYFYHCRFEGNGVDFKHQSLHGNSIRRCVSVGSGRFIENRGTGGPLFIQDVIVDGWTNPEGAIYDSFGSLTMVDVDFINAPSANPVLYQRSQYTSTNLISNVTWDSGSPDLLDKGSYDLVADLGSEPRAITDSSANFFKTSLLLPQQVFDIRDYGASLSNADNSVAIEAAISAADAVPGAMVYIPNGTWKLMDSIDVSASDIVISGTGYYTQFNASQAPMGTFVFNLQDAINVELTHMNMNRRQQLATEGGSIYITGTSPLTKVLIDRIFTYQSDGTLDAQLHEGLVVEGLPSGALVHTQWIEGSTRLIDCQEATYFSNYQNGSGFIVEGSTRPRTGFVGLTMGNANNVQIRDNNSVTWTDFYTEQSGGWGNSGLDQRNAIYLFGDGFPGTGNAIFGAHKFAVADTRMIIRSDNYAGTFALVDASINTAHFLFSSYRVTTYGSAELDLAFIQNYSADFPTFFDIADPAATDFYALGNRSRAETDYDWQSWSGTTGPQWVASPVTAPATGSSLAASFDGIDDFASIGNKEFNENTPALTVAFWIRPDPAGSGQPVVLGELKRSDNRNDKAWFELIGGSLDFTVRDNDDVEYVAGSTTLPTDLWSHVVGTWDGNTVSLYVNGNLIDSAPADFTKWNASSEFFLVGGKDGHFFKGSIDELTILKRSWTAAEVVTHYSNGTGTQLSNTDTDLIALLHFDNGGTYFENNIYKEPYVIGGGTPGPGEGMDDRKDYGTFYEYRVSHSPADREQKIANIFDAFRRVGSYDLSINYPVTIDTDEDGLSDDQEALLGTDPSLPDSDGDGLTDGEEATNYGTNPLVKDSDADGIDDNVEIAGGTDPNDDQSPAPSGSADTVVVENSFSRSFTASEVADGDFFLSLLSDRSGLFGTVTLHASLNGAVIGRTFYTNEDQTVQSLFAGYSMMTASGAIEHTYTWTEATDQLNSAGVGILVSPNIVIPPPVDTDGDLLTDEDELNLYGTDPSLKDTDGDGIEDGAEVSNGSDPLDINDPILQTAGPGVNVVNSYSFAEASMSLSETIDVGINSDRLVLISVATRNDALSTITLGGIDLSANRLSYTSAESYEMATYYALDPATGSHSLDITLAGTNNRMAVSVLALSGVEQTTPAIFDELVDTKFDSSTFSHSYSVPGTEIGDLVMTNLADRFRAFGTMTVNGIDGGSAVAPTLYADEDQGIHSLFSAYSEVTAGGTVDHSYTWTEETDQLNSAGVAILVKASTPVDSFAQWASERGLTIVTGEETNQFGLSYRLLYALGLEEDATSDSLQIQIESDTLIVSVTLPNEGLKLGLQAEYRIDLSTGEWTVLPVGNMLDGADCLDAGKSGTVQFSLPSESQGFSRLKLVD